MTTFYLDTSIAVHTLTGEVPRVRRWFDAVATSDDHEIVSSRLLQTELTRVLRRERRPLHERDAVLDAVGLTPITEGILTAAEAITEHVKTLDAIHLATALAFGSRVVLATHDAGLQTGADRLGLRWTDPVEAGTP